MPTTMMTARIMLVMTIRLTVKVKLITYNSFLK